MGSHEVSIRTPVTLDVRSWEGPVGSEERERAIEALEHGRVLFLPAPAFQLHAGEHRFLSAQWSAGRAKNISYDLQRPDLRGARITGPDRQALQAMIARYATATRRLVDALLPPYRLRLQQARTSFRPVAAIGRVSSWRKDDRRLHTDAYPSRPTRGARILRVFSNVNPDGEPRIWRVGEPFEDLARKFLPSLRRPLPGVSAILATLGITKGRRAAYDHLVLQLHDSVKRDGPYQERAPPTRVAFPAGSTWIVFTDQVLHAAMSGQYLFEQTFHLPVSDQRWPETAPLRVLERLTGRGLAERVHTPPASPGARRIR